MSWRLFFILKNASVFTSAEIQYIRCRCFSSMVIARSKKGTSLSVVPFSAQHD